jgi:peptidoglycan/xylan/chitin deacetylase (PgdA/CDA1 family)
VRGGYRLWQIRTVVRCRLDPGGIVLAYHRVEEEPPRDALGLAVSAAHFAEQLNVLRDMAKPVGLRDLAAGLDSGRGMRGRVCLTFDDGYVDNLVVAKPLLESHEVPATVFVTSGYVGAEREFWWDQVERVAARSGEDVLALRARLRMLSPAELEQVTACWAETDAGLQDARAPRHRVLTAEEIVRLVEGGLVDVGSHTVTHAPLGLLSPAEQRTELRDSRLALERIVGRPVELLSYPFGGVDDLTSETASLAALCGYRLACANWPGMVWPGSDRMRLPRLVVRDWSGDEFAQRLGPWLAGRGILAAT